MKKLMTILLLTLLATSCTKSTKHGECIGLANEDEIKVEKLNYKYSKWNIFLAVIFSETLVAPVNVVGYNLRCPVGVK